MRTDGARAAESPPGWSYDPSTWRERMPLIALAGVGGAIASYLALYQVGIVRSVWDPFFGRGSATILHSPVSRLLPIPDAALGALGYLVDAVSGLVGGEARWRTMPWIVIVFGFAVGPLGAVSLALVVLQPVLFDAWCTLCLASALISVLMIGPAMDELLASLQLLARERARGRSVWRTFWRGGATTPATSSPAAPPAEGRAGGWARAATVALGAWTMAAPAVLGLQGSARVGALVVGPLAVCAGLVAASEVTRPIRWVGVPLGAWLVIAALAFAQPPNAALALAATGVALAASGTVRGRRRERLGGGWRALRTAR